MDNRKWLRRVGTVLLGLTVLLVVVATVAYFSGDAKLNKVYNIPAQAITVQIDPKHMPWNTHGKMTDDELKAIFLYLKSLPAKQTGA